VTLKIRISWWEYCFRDRRSPSGRGWSGWTCTWCSPSRWGCTRWRSASSWHPGTGASISGQPI